MSSTLCNTVAAQIVSTETLPIVLVTAEKQLEPIQDVPFALTTLSDAELRTRGVAGGANLYRFIPNTTFSKNQFTGFNFQIRGVGSKLIAGSADQGVGIHHNHVPLTANRFYEAEFYDLDRVEVLRGPQGTIYGRNATGGVFNAITAKPTGNLEGSITLDGGNYDSRRLKARPC